MLTLDTLRVLQSDAGAALLAELAEADLSDANTLRLLTDLRKQHPANVAAAALETARLRIKGRQKFGERADRMFFTRDALEQATDAQISQYRFAALTPTPKLAADLGCGIGGDTLALAEIAPVIGIDHDPLRLAIAHANLATSLAISATQTNALFVQADLRDPLPFTRQIDTLFFDPARRVEGQRIYSVKDYIPPLDVALDWLRAAPHRTLSVKLSPGVNLDELKSYSDGIEFISLEGDLKEAVLHLGANVSAPERLATLIDAAGNAIHLRRDVAALAPDIPIFAPRRVLYEPDPAIIRAGLVQDLGAQLDAALLDSTIAYLTADVLTVTPYARAWYIDDWMPFNLKKLRAYLREHGIGRITVKKRGSPLTPEELIARLKLPGGGDERIVVLTRVQGSPAILICRMVL